MASTGLGKRQQQIYDYICEYANRFGYPPSVREIGAAVGLASPSTVHVHLKCLEDRGYIRRNPNKPRALELLVHDSPTQRAHHQEGLVSVDIDPNSDAISLPVVGRVAAGSPILAEQNIEDRLVLPTSIVGDACSFILRVRGDSMINAGIFDGDYIVVKEQSDAHNGEIVVALLDDSATVKTFYREPHRVRLQPENDSMEPIYVENPVILGKVCALIRSL